MAWIYGSLSVLGEIHSPRPQLVVYEVGAGSSIWFWNDMWCVVIPFKLQYPELY